MEQSGGRSLAMIAKFAGMRRGSEGARYATTELAGDANGSKSEGGSATDVTAWLRSITLSTRIMAK